MTRRATASHPEVPHSTPAKAGGGPGKKAYRPIQLADDDVMKELFLGVAFTPQPAPSNRHQWGDQPARGPQPPPADLARLPTSVNRALWERTSRK